MLLISEPEYTGPARCLLPAIAPQPESLPVAQARRSANWHIGRLLALTAGLLSASTGAALLLLPTVISRWTLSVLLVQRVPLRLSLPSGTATGLPAQGCSSSAALTPQPTPALGRFGHAC